PLENIANGDTIRIEWFDTHHRELRERSYAVDTIRVVDPHDTTLLAPTSEDTLTLITCYPFGSRPNSPQRYVVRASPLGPGQRVESAPVENATQKSPDPHIVNGRNDLRIPLRTIW